MNTLADSLITKAIDLGATVAGIASMGALLYGPSHDGFPITRQTGNEDSILVTGLHHPPSEPGLDWYTGRGGTEGNRILMEVNSSLAAWLEAEHGVVAQDLPYYVEKGGVFLKDAAVLAGLGVVGVHNLLMVPGYGPNIRVRGLFINAHLPVTARADYSPCDGCHQPCLEVCPEGAITEDTFDREACLRHMSRDGAGDLVMDASAMEKNVEVRFCRECEFACTLSGQAPSAML